jgi:hypothetical protein
LRESGRSSAAGPGGGDDHALEGLATVDHQRPPAGELWTSARLGPHARMRQPDSLRRRLASLLDAGAPATVSGRSLSIRVTRDRAKLTVQPARRV